MVDSRVKSEERRKKKKRKIRDYEEKERDRKTLRVEFPEEKEAEGAGEGEGEGEEEIHEHGEAKQKSHEGPWKNLDLILSLQSKESDIQRKVELAFHFVNSKVTKEGDEPNEAVEMVSVSRLVIFLNDWIQSLLTSSDKRNIVEGKKLGSRVMEACLDFRCWVVFKFCLGKSTNQNISLSFSPNLLRAMSCIVKDALSKVDSALHHGEELVLIGEGLELYTVVADCVTLLFSSGGRVFNANVDLWASMVMLVLELVHKIYSYNLTFGNAASLLLRLSCLLLEPFTNVLRVHPSPKNVFPVIVDRLLELLLSLLAVLDLQTNGASSSSMVNLLKIVEDILLNGLFHPAHVDGFLSTHTTEKYIRCHDRKGKDPKKVIKSYHRHFFQKLEKIMGEKKVSVLGGLGELFRLFVVRVKKQKRASVLSESSEKMTKTMIANHLEGGNTGSTSNLSTRNKDTVLEKSYFSCSLDMETCKTLFDLFAQFMEYLLLDLKSYSETEMEEEKPLLDIHCSLKCGNKVIASFMHENVYKQTEDTAEGAHLNFLKLIYDTIISFSSKIHLIWLSESKRGEGRHKEMLPSIAKEIIVGVCLFLEFEYKVVENDLVNVWLMMLSFLAIEQSQCETPGESVLTSEILRLGCQLINIYSELRQVNVPIFALFESVRIFGFCDDDGQKNYTRFVSASSLPSEACVRSVATLVCSPDFRLAISSAIKSIPEGQASGCIRMLKTDISSSLEWMKVTSSAGVFGKANLLSDSFLVLNFQAELLGRALSELYTIILDSLTVTARNSILVGSSVKDLMNEICPTLGCLVGEQNESVNEFLFSVTGRRFSNHKMPEQENNLTTTVIISAWSLIFFFRLYVSCRSLYRQSISLMPPDSSRKASAAMGDLFAAYSGKDWMEKTDWTNDGYFSWIMRPSTSLLTTIESVSKFCRLQNVAECPPLIYVLHTMAFQRIVDLNRQIKAFEFLQERVIRLVQLEMDDSGLRLSRKENKKWKRKISVLKKEAADLTNFMMAYLPLIAKQETSVYAGATYRGKDACDGHENEATWDFCVSSVNEKSLPTALWWSLCQNTDIWCSHASKKELKKFLSLLLYNYLYCMRSSFCDAKNQNMDESYETGYLRKVAMHQISLELLSDIVLYEESSLCRHLRSRVCHILEESIAPLFRDSLPKGVNFSALPNWPEVLGLLEEKSMLVYVAHGVSSMENKDSVLSNLPAIGSLKGLEALRTAGTDLEACQTLINFLGWMSKSYSNSRSSLIYATYILNLERLVVFRLLDFDGEINTLNHKDLFRLFVSCRRALKYLIMACSEEKMEVGTSSVISVLFESSDSLLWLLRSLSAVIGLSVMGSEECGDPVKDMVFSLMDHTSYLFLMIAKEHFRLAIHSVVYDQNPCVEFLQSGMLCKEDNLVDSDSRFDSSGDVNAWKVVVLMADCLKEHTQSFLEALKNAHCNAKFEPVVDVVNLNKLSSIISCFQGFLWGLASVLNNVFEKCSTMKTKSLISKLVHIPELCPCISVFEDFILFCLRVLLFENGSLSFKDPCCSSHKYSGDELMNTGKQEEEIEGGKLDVVLHTDNYHGSAMNSGVNGVRNFSALKKSMLSENSEHTDDDTLTEDSLELQNLKKNLMQSLLKGEHPEVAVSVRQVFVAASAILGLQLRINCSPLSSTLIPIFVGISQFFLMEFSKMTEMPHSFSFVWLDGVLKYLEVLGSYFSSTNATSSRSAYARLIDIHLRAIGKCISLQGKGATLHSHERQLGKETLQGQIGSFVSPSCHGLYSLGEFKARLMMSFTVFIREPLELHLLSAVQAIERALVGVQEGCNVVYEISTGIPDGGKVSSVVAAAVDCLDVVLESVSGRKRLNVVKRHIQSLVTALFNIVVHLRGPRIFCVKLAGDNRDTDPDPGSVILMCVQVLTKVAGKHALFQMDSSHVGQTLHAPAMLFKDFCQLRASQATSNPLFFNEQEAGLVAGTYTNVVDQEFSVELFSACCRLLCTMVRHHKSETERCIALFEDSVSALLHCLETVDADLMVRKGSFSLDVQQGVKCASFLRRIYEEIRQQKDILGRYCFQFLSNYIWIYSGYGPHKTGLKREIDEALRPGVYALVDVCSPDDLQQLHTVLGEGPCRSTLATLQRDYKLNFQYEGKV